MKGKIVLLLKIIAIAAIIIMGAGFALAEDGTVYKVTLNTNGGTVKSGDVNSYTQGGEDVTLPTNVKKAGYTFDGWYADETFSGNKVTSIPGTETGDKEYFAKWILNPKANSYNKISGGMYHNLAIDQNGNLIVWGLNNNGQLGDGTTADRIDLTHIMDGTTFTEISAGGLFSLAIDNAGNLYAWGANGVGQLGDGTTVNKLVPTQIMSGTTFKAISAGISHSLAIDVSGNLYVWGNNNKGQLGNGTTTNISTPTQIMSGTTFTAIAAAQNYSLAIDSNGNLYAWGENNNGELGTGDTTAYTVPTQVMAGTTFKSVVAGRGQAYNLAIDTNGNLYSWGQNTYGQLGNNSTDDVNTPTQILAGTTFEKISVGYNTSFAIDTDGNLYAWGANGNGELGDGTKTLRKSPVKVAEGTKFTDVSATWNHTLALGETGNLYAWGSNENGELGNGTTESKLVPTVIAESTDAKYKVEYYKQNLTLDGYELAEEIELIDTKGQTVTAEKKEYEGFTAKELPSGVVKSDGSLVLKVYYDRNKYKVTLNRNKGLIQEGNITEYTYGIETTLPTNVVYPGNTFGGWYDNESLTGTAVTKISATDTGDKTYYAKWTEDYKKMGFVKVAMAKASLSLAIAESGNLYAWGTGYLGNGTTTSAVPIQIKKELKFKEVSTGAYHVLAIDENENLWAWGGNTSGQLGDGTNVAKTNPVQVKSGTKFKKVATGNEYSIVLDIDGNIWSCGYNIYGVLGNGATNSNNVLTKITSGTKFKDISAGHFHNIALDEDGNIWTWGHNSNGQLGDGTTTDSSVPKKINVEKKFKQILAVGGNNGSSARCFAIDESGKLWTWGHNSNGQLGDGTTEDKLTPVQINVETKFKKVVGGNTHNLALDENGNLWTWGYNSSGELGNGTTSNSFIPKKIEMEEKFKEVAAGASSSFAIDENGNLWAWGYNQYKILGDGTTTDRLVPTKITTAESIKFGLTLDLGGATLEDGDITDYKYGTTTILPIPKKPGYVFKGWYTNPEFTGDAVTEIADDDYGDKSFYAKWEPATDTPYKVEHYTQNDTLDGYDLLDENIENLTGTTDTKVTATAKTIAGYEVNKSVRGTVESGTILGDGSLVLKLYYDKIIETTFDIELSQENVENSLSIEGSKYNISLKRSDATVTEWKDKTTDENGKIRITAIDGKNTMKVYYEAKSVPGSYVLDTSKKYVEITVDKDTKQIKLTGKMSTGAIAYVEDNVLYIIEQTYMKNVENSIRVSAVDSTDSTIKLGNVSFEIYYPDGRVKPVVTGEDGTAEISNIVAPGTGSYLYEVRQLNTIRGYKENTKSKYINIVFNADGIITDAQDISATNTRMMRSRVVNRTAGVTTETEGTDENVIANINVEQQRDATSGSTTGAFSDYTLKIIEKDADTNDNVQAVTYKVTQQNTNNSITDVSTTTQTTDVNGEIVTEVANGETVVIKIKRINAPTDYKFNKQEITINLTRNSAGEYIIDTPVDGVEIDTATKQIIVNRSIVKRISVSNTARTRVNATFYITKVDQYMRALQGVTLELRENATGTKWELKTDDNGLAKIESQDLIDSLGSEYPQYLNSAEGKLTFWITEKSVPVGFERINEDIGFEMYYETTPEGILEVTYMNVLDGLSYTHIVDQEYTQYEADEYMQLDVKMKVVNVYSTEAVKLNSLEIEKVDAKNTNTKLSGASFQITVMYPTAGKLRTTYTSNKNGIIDISNLYFPEGTSTVQILEKKAPTGYVLDKTPTTIKVTNTSGVITVDGATLEGSTIKVKITNTKETEQVPYRLVIQKRDADTYELIDRTATFNVQIENNGYNSTESLYTTDGTATFTDNGRGKIAIAVTETEAPYGYTKDSETKVIYIQKDSLYGSIKLDTSKTQDTENVQIVGNTIYLTVYNTRGYYTSNPYISIKKVDKDNTKLGLRYAKFAITGPDLTGERITTTGKTGYAGATLNSATSGRYIIEEREAPTGYKSIKKIAVDIVFDSNGNITSYNLVKDLGSEYDASNVLEISSNQKTLSLKIGNEQQEKTTVNVIKSSTYTLKIDKVSSISDSIKLDGAKFDIDIDQQNGSDYSFTDTTYYERGIIINNLYGTGKIDVSLREIMSPSGYICNGATRKLSFTRDSVTKELTLDESSLTNLDVSDVKVDNVNKRITIKVRNIPATYTPVIDIDGNTSTVVPPEGVTYNSLTIENENIENHNIKIEGTTFRVYKLSESTYISSGKTNKYGLTTISLGNEVYTTTVRYLIENYKMEELGYIRNNNVVLEVTYNSDGTMTSASIVQGERDSKGRIVAEIDDGVNYVGGHRIKVHIRCERVGYTPIASGKTEWSSASNPRADEKRPTTTPEKVTSPVTPTDPADPEPDFGVQIEKVNVYNNKIKVAGAKYAIYVENEDTNESQTIIETTDKEGKISFTGLLGYGNFKITMVEIESPDGYALDEKRQVVRINRAENSQLIKILDKDLGENAYCKIDNINKIVKTTIEESPSTIGFAILKQDYDDELIALKNGKFEIVDTETNEIYELESGVEGMGYVSLPMKSNGEHSFSIRETLAPEGYNAISSTLTLKVTYLNGLIASATVEGDDEHASVTNKTTEYIEVNVLNEKKKEGVCYSIELIKADAYYSSITFADAKIKIDVDNEKGIKGLTKTDLTDENGKINIDNIYGSGKVDIDITELVPPVGRRFDTKDKQVQLNIDETTGWIKLSKGTKNVDTFIDNKAKKVTIRLRNYPDDTIVIGANKVDENDNNLMLIGAEYSIRLQSATSIVPTKQYANGLLAFTDIALPSETGIHEYTYIINETKAPFGYALDSTDIVLKVTVQNLNGFKKITNAYIESGRGTVEVYGDEFIHLKFEDTVNSTTDTYNVSLNKVDSLNKEYAIEGALIGIHVKAESGEDYYKEILTDVNGQINLNDIRGTGRIEVTIEELKPSDYYVNVYETKKIVFTRDAVTNEITMETDSADGVVSEENSGNVNIVFENELDADVAVSITATKVWNDNNNKAGKRPTQVTLQILNGAEVVASKIVDETYKNAADENEWKYVFTALPKYDSNGNVINYTVEEQEVNSGDLKFYTSSIDTSTNTITNTFTVPGDTVSVTAHKVWVDTLEQKDKRPATIKIVVKNGSTAVKEETITTDSDKDVVFDNLPKYDLNGNVINYTVEEQEVNSGDLKFYTSSIDTSTNTITNTFTVPGDTVSVTAHKVWVDTLEQKDKRPATIKIVVKNGSTAVKEETITTDSDKDVVFDNLPKYDLNGNVINYTVEEQEVNSGDLKFYTSSIDTSTNTITNTFTVPGDTVSVTAHKVWVDTLEQKDKRPATIKIVVKNGSTAVKEETITTDSDKDVVFDNLPKYDLNGNVINYTVEEQEVNSGDLKFYTSSIDTSTNTITNTFTVPGDTVSVTAHKVWVDTLEQKDKRPATIKIVVKNGSTAVKEETITTDSDKDVVFDNLPKYDLNGNVINYTVEEQEVNSGDLKFYTSSIDTSTNTITNTFTVPGDTVSVTAHKVWVDTLEQKDKRPATIKIVVKNGSTAVKEETITTDSDKDVVFDNLPKYDLNGNVINYTVEEQEVNSGDLKFYTSSIDTSTNTITNTFTVPGDTVSVTAHKVWVDTLEQKDKRPANIKIVVKNGTTVVKEETITTDSDKDVVFNNLPKYDSNGNVITYTVEEQEVNSGDLKFYTSSIDTSTNTITNTFTLPGELLNVTIRKVYKGTNIGLKGATIKLIDENGVEQTAVTDENGDVTFSGLKLGKVYTYKETIAPSGYTLNSTEYSFRVEDDGTITDIVGNRIIENERVRANATIQKYVTGTTETVTGAEIGIYDEHGNLVTINGVEMKGTTGANGQITFMGLEPGTYYYKEITAPSGYVLNTDAYKFTVNEDGTITFENSTEGILYNDRLDLGVTIRKVYKGTNIGLKGATIKLIDENGVEQTAVTDENGDVTFSGLKLGKVYTYKETIAPSGYTLNSTEYSFRVEDDGTITDIVGNRIIENERVRANATIQKYVTGTTETVTGAEIGIYDEHGNLVTINGVEMKGTTGANGQITFMGLEPGTYYYKEITAPSGYVLNTDAYKFTVNEDGTITFENSTGGILYNDRLTVGVTIRKVDTITKIGLEGATIVVIDEDGVYRTAVTDKNGYATFVGLNVGKTYTYKETIAPTGYTLNDVEYSFRINEDGTITDLLGNRVIENEPGNVDDGKIGVVITKIDAETKLALEGATIGIYDKDGNALLDEKGNRITGITNKDGTITFIVPKTEKTYVYKEITAPKGYKINDTQYSFKVKSDGTIVDIVGNRIIEDYIILGKIEIFKVEYGTENYLANTEISIYNYEDYVKGNAQALKELWTTVDGKVIFDGLKVGKYVVKETKAPDGYNLDSKPLVFEVNEKGEIVILEGSVKLEDTRIKEPELVLPDKPDNIIPDNTTKPDTPKDNTTANGKIPQTGKEMIVPIIAINVAIGFAVYFYRKIKY